MTLGSAEYLAEALRRYVPAASILPVDPYAVARHLGVGEIVTDARLLEDGRLEQVGKSVRVVLARRGSAVRHRYTLAHEIGHLLLADPDQDLIARRMRSDDEVERFCDSFAAALLLPRRLVISAIGKKPANLHTVRYLTQMTQVSMAAATVRLVELCGWDRSLLHWKRSAPGWRYRWGAAVPRDLYRTLRSSEATSRELDDLPHRCDHLAEVSMRAGNRNIRLAGEFSVHGPSALGLVKF